MTSRKTLFAAFAVFSLLVSPALAAAGGNGHGNGHGNGNGNGNGNGKGNSGGNGNAGGNGGGGGSLGKSASAKGQVAKAATGSVSKEKNIHAKLGRLNSLQRNANAFMHSKSKNFAGVQAFVTQSAIAKNAQSALEAANQAVADAKAALDALNAKAADPNTPPEDVPTQADLDAAQAALDDATQDAAAAQTAATAAAANVPSIDAALAQMANKPVDPEVTDWANSVLADKIDQVAAKLAPAAP
ncbi:hypothetical protein NLY43_00850 [Mesorhizobium sp. C416B]|uniref:hypothetical protein n=1 Tax=unclassified Mesorhizobium TaxID=325217 RepID=UPI0003CF801E|nr:MULTISPECIES: hypothetical protein [unclassified Mesorhizobium]ESX49866.1 hypothetical protein X762_07280 [Mesorhizobium sp. LSHC426A00]ESX57298.1 hypothetical protein X761_06185 [Mesorhizobium sp. LSHC424B00]ESX75129.1 hypothetical protein X758_05770 [Mesorhizobium sp. LSHC416B00]WJI63369.1 hypothetical protein NLY43_00850 [Mesorhizobium sp. C416B]